MKTTKRFFIAIVLLGAAMGLYYQFWFLRLPDRSIPVNEKLFVSPANGKVVAVFGWNDSIVQITKKEFGAFDTWVADVDTAGTIIHIQMDVTNVHYQRAPTNAVLVSKKYVTGNFSNAVVMNNEWGIRFENEHNELTFENTNGKKYKLVQIAGFVARRIEDFLTKGQQVKQGDVIGLIKLGSQVTVILPSGVQLKTKTGEVVTEGESVLAEW